MEYAKFITEDSLEKYADIRFLKNKDLLWNSTGLGTLGRIAIYFDELNSYELSVVDSHVTVVRLLKVVPEYIYYYLSSYYVQSVIEDKADGSTKQKELSLATISGYLLPLPPLSEQKRIVAKIEELLPFVEQYAKKEQELTALHQAFPEQLKKSILQAAIQGKLTEQNSNDEPAVELVKRIQAEKERLISEKKIKKPKQTSEIFVRDNLPYEIINGVERCIADEIPFAIPENWCWVRLGDIILNNIGGGTPNKSISDYWKGNIPWASVKDIDKDSIYLNNTIDRISEEGLRESSSNIIKKGNVILCTRMGLGKIAINNIDVSINQDLRGIELPNELCKLYFIYFYKTLTMQGQGLTVKGITVEQLNSILFPLPPTSEQKRIVSKIEQLFSSLENLPK